jgi:3-phenylpropionate/trans-cinnamate dioxygenase ferredoxin subunit
MARYVVGTVDEFPPGTRRVVEIGGRMVGIFNVNGELFALLNRCPHQGAPLCEGRTFGFLKPGQVGEFNYERPGEMLRCPWHGWEFDLRTGQSWFDPKLVRVRRYDVKIEQGAALLEAEAASAPARAGWEKGPFSAETFPVSIEEEYVVIEVGRAGAAGAP